MLRATIILQQKDPHDLKTMARRRVSGFIMYKILSWPYSSWQKPIREAIIKPVTYPTDETAYDIYSYRQPGQGVLRLDEGYYVMEMQAVFGEQSIKEKHMFQVSGEYPCIPARKPRRNLSLSFTRFYHSIRSSGAAFAAVVAQAGEITLVHGLIFRF